MRLKVPKPRIAPDGFDERLWRSMADRQITASELARLVGVSPTAVSNWHHGNTLPRPQTLAKIVDILGVSEEYLLTGEDETRSNQANSENSIAELVDDLRITIARMTGFAADKVKVKVELQSE